MRLSGEVEVRFDLRSLYRFEEDEDEDEEVEEEVEEEEVEVEVEEEGAGVDKGVEEEDRGGEGTGAPDRSTALTQHRDLSITATTCRAPVSLTSTL